MSRIALQAWAEALRDADLADHIEQTLTRFRELYAEVVRRWQAAGHVDPVAQQLLLPGTDRDQYIASVRPLVAQAVTEGTQDG